MINPLWLIRNIATSWRNCAKPVDAVRRLLFNYSHKLPSAIWRDEWTIGFRYAEPVGLVKLVLRSNNGSDGFIHGEVFEHNYYDLRLAHPPTTILDLGANIGLTSVYFGRQFPNAKIVCVEPVPGNLRVLERNLQLNGIKAKVIAAAIDPEDGSVRMELGPMDYGHKVASGQSAGLAIEVEAVSVPTLLRRLGWDRIDLVKIDIEGHEKELLGRNCEWLNLVETVCIECHDGFDVNLPELAQRFGFGAPKRLPGVWIMTRNGPHRIVA